MAKSKKSTPKPRKGDQLIPTARGTKIFRQDLTRKLARANALVKKARESMTPSEWNAYRREFVTPGMRRKGDRLSIKGETNVGALMAAESAAERIIKAGTRKYQQIREEQTEKRYKSFEEDWGFTREEVDMLHELLFSSPEWQIIRQAAEPPSSEVVDNFVKGWRDGTLNLSKFREAMNAAAWDRATKHPGDFSKMETPKGWATASEEWEEYTPGDINKVYGAGKFGTTDYQPEPTREIREDGTLSGTWDFDKQTYADAILKALLFPYD